MCTKTNEETTTRDLNELLRLDTYQGMTDFEIDMVMQYRVDVALQSAELETAREIHEQAASEIVADNANSAQQALTMLQSMVSKVVPVDLTPFEPTKVNVVASNPATFEPTEV